MKYTIIFFFFLFSFCNINSQNETVNQRAKSGDLTLSECLDRRVLEQGTDIVPSLLKIKNGLKIIFRQILLWKQSIKPAAGSIP